MYLDVSQVSRLEGFKVPYHPDNSYLFDWFFRHEEDINQNNNDVLVTAKGQEFESSCKLKKNHMCDFFTYQYNKYHEFIEDSIYEQLNPAIGERKVLVILWDPGRQEHKRTLTKRDIQKLIFGEDTSVKDYFLENSGQSLELKNVGILGWYDANESAETFWGHWDQEDLPEDRNQNGQLDPGEDLNGNGRLDGPDGILQSDEDINKNGKLDYDLNNDGWIRGHRQKWAEAIRKASRDFDFNSFDLNHDKYLSKDELITVMVIPQSNSYGTFRDTVVGKEYPKEEPLIVDGVTIKNIVEVYTGANNNNNNDIGVFAHELAHILIGAGDMYFVRPKDAKKDSKVTFPTFMAQGYSLMYNHPANPPHLDPYHKLKAGWLCPEIVTSSGWYELSDVETSDSVLILHDPKRDKLGFPDKINKEYFIVENRWSGNSYDARANISDNGLAIWHIIEAPGQVLRKLPKTSEVKQKYWDSEAWQGWGRKGVRMIRPIMDTPYNASLWRGGDPQIADNLTLKWIDGTSSGFSIRDISPSRQTMRMRIEIQ